jgi:hypothetical protein
LKKSGARLLASQRLQVARANGEILPESGIFRQSVARLRAWLRSIRLDGVSLPARAQPAQPGQMAQAEWQIGFV